MAVPNAQVPAAIISTSRPLGAQCAESLAEWRVHRCHHFGDVVRGWLCFTTYEPQPQCSVRVVKQWSQFLWSECKSIGEPHDILRCRPLKSVNDCCECTIRIGISIWEKGAIHPSAIGKRC